MARIPFGVSRLDRRIGGGAPTGSVVLLAGEAGAGARELLYTSAIINGLSHADEDLFDLHYGDLIANAKRPEEIHYVSFTGGRENLREEMGYTMDEEIVESGLDAVQFADLSSQFFQLSPVPRAWYSGSYGNITDLGKREERRTVIEALADHLDQHASNSLFCIDSLTDLISVRDEEDLSFQDIVYTLKVLRKASHRWEGLLLVHVSLESVRDIRLGDLMAAGDGTLICRWEEGGNELARTLMVREFRGVLSQLEEEDIVRFETEIHEAGFDISDVRKIRYRSSNRQRDVIWV
ncbi:MAG: RAD55 family ATPase, partial [Halobacteriaceae archaeon]